jgi:uncharacterized flavoprotein (TIGR03862 family)
MTIVAVIGGGPAGLMAADVLSQQGTHVDLYEAKPSVGRKFLVAGKGGLNLTHSEPFESFLSRFGSASPRLRPILEAFGPNDIREWAQDLGIETFIGFSRRVFPQDMQAAPLLRRWVQRLRDRGVKFHARHRWQGWNDDGSILFSTKGAPLSVLPDATILTLGGGSWPKLGSDAAWVPVLSQRGIDIAPLQPSNCGFDVGWSNHFRERFAGEPLKSVVLTFTNSQGDTFQRQGACVITETGLEGSLIYATSAALREEISEHGFANIHLDLAPDRSLANLIERLSIPRGSRSVSSHLKSKVRIKGVPAGLLREFARDTLNDPIRLSAAIKALPIKLLAARPLEEAISTAGGVRFEALDEHLMVRTRPGLFCAGEMLDWEAPTGGYLLTACFASGRMAGLGALAWTKKGTPEQIVRTSP